VEENQEPTYRVVRFEVIPQSIKLEGERLLGRGAEEKNLLQGPELNAADVSGYQSLVLLWSGGTEMRESEL